MTEPEPAPVGSNDYPATAFPPPLPGPGETHEDVMAQLAQEAPARG